MKTYDPAFVILSFKGVRITGFATGTYLRVERAEDTYKMESGALGDVTRVRMRDKRGTITFMLMKESSVNDILTAFMLADETANLGVGIAQVENLNGTTLHHSPEAWIRKPPQDEYSTDANEIEWILDCASLTMELGGSII